MTYNIFYVRYIHIALCFLRTTLNENNWYFFRYTWEARNMQFRSTEMHMDRSISLFIRQLRNSSRAYGTAEMGSLSRHGRGTRKFGRFHESQMRDEMTLNSRTFARTRERRYVRWRVARRQRKKG